MISSVSHENEGHEYQEGVFNNHMYKGESEFGEHPFFQVGEYIDYIIIDIYSDNHEAIKYCSLNECYVLKWEVNDAKGIGIVSIDQFEINCESISSYY